MEIYVCGPIGTKFGTDVKDLNGRVKCYNRANFLDISYWGEMRCKLGVKIWSILSYSLTTVQAFSSVRSCLMCRFKYNLQLFQTWYERRMEIDIGWHPVYLRFAILAIFRRISWTLAGILTHCDNLSWFILRFA